MARRLWLELESGPVALASPLTEMKRSADAVVRDCLLAVDASARTVARE